MTNLSHYTILGVLPSADTVVIKAAYRALAQKYHPDKWAASETEAAERMAAINLAYEVLLDPVRRQSYDESLRSFVDESEVSNCQEAPDTRENTPSNIVVQCPRCGASVLLSIQRTTTALCEECGGRFFPLANLHVRRNRITGLLILLAVFLVLALSILHRDL